MKLAQYRQGDVLIERVAEPIVIHQPEAREGGRVVLAHGEVTGHAHAIREEGAAKSAFRGEEAAGAPIQVSDLEVTAAMAAVRHEEHGAIPLEAGSYRVTRQREYAPEAIRNVAD